MGRQHEQHEGFKSLGKNVKIYPSAKIIGREYISVADNVIIDDFVFIHATAPIFIGSYIHIASFTSITGGGVIVLEDFSTLSSGVRIFSGSDDFHGGGMTNSTIPDRYRSVSRTHVHVGRHVIIGTNSVILPSVKLAEGVAVGAGAVVTRSLDAWGVYVGSPAHRLKDRPSKIILDHEQALIDEGLFTPMSASVFDRFLARSGR
ncbi:acyltransferase [Pseudomonas sp. 10B1]|uniref:acyltransferase n=1 Tax=unclassified Pseudomonas TaxID=196821 RepID=UPI002AB588C0|nr:MULTISPECIES: acyltransferase [unclassified Pseudomonas]MDY7560789.1 acyltransferase [Pseudomonas sp. AB6]MEA9976544.1 acyltransferase [Pseudomonas sp. RTS4]MEA9996872.1 acyltransferase [Pseudomonas sp. AA4]MEB0087295.1 acyltransferase [Pseudomonas sp. RTI1]MEB0128082.1 acyltransferase [Pseudomonas sp. CCC1.2]